MKTYKCFCLLFFFYLFCSSFVGAQVKPYDILINEFMPAPDKNSLLNSEYIELYNRSKDSIDLAGYMIVNKPDITILEKRPSKLKPNGYVVIYTKNANVDFRRFDSSIDTIQVKKLGTLSNPSDMLYLVAPNDTVIDAAGYDLSYYQNVGKGQEGLALERTRPNAPCNGSTWTPSIDSRKATPGKINSTVDFTSEKTWPQIERYYVEGDNKIVLVFDRSLNRDLAKDSSNYQLGSIKINNSIKLLEPAFNTVELSLKTALKIETLYKLIIKPLTKDCQGLPILGSVSYTLDIRLPEKPKIKELIVNEILVNPETGGSRFIELYNTTSNKAFDIKDLKIKDTTKNDMKLVLKNFLLLPNRYVALTDKPFYIRKRYNVPDSIKFNIIENKLPTWNEASGNVSISSGDTLTFDNINYTKSWHNPLLATTDGVSLERTNPFADSSDSTNWQSAAEKRGFATPAQKNSQYRDLQVTPSVSAPFWLEKDSFSPDDDGFEDALLVHYKLDKKGGVANVQVFDSNGRFVKSLSINELLGTEGVLRWQGERADGTKAVVGIYILVLDLTFSDGTTARQKMPCALTTQF